MEKEEPWDLWKSIKLIGGSLLFVSLPATLFTYECFLKKNRQDAASYIEKIIQTGPQKEVLKTRFFAEVLHLSADRKVKVKNFDLKKAKERLLAHPVIESVELSIVDKDALYIDYVARNPIAMLGNFDNVALDKKGFIFPIKPFFPPKKLPALYFPQELFDEAKALTFNKPLSGPYVDLAFSILDLLASDQLKGTFDVKTIDVSKAFEKSLGSQEIVLEIEEAIPYPAENKTCLLFQKRYLRFNVKGIAKGLGNYMKLREKMAEEAILSLKTEGLESVREKRPIIDLRLDKLAFIKEEKL